MLTNKRTCFKCDSGTDSSGTVAGTLRAGVLSSSTTTSVTESQQVDGDLVTSVIEFKTSEYSRDHPV